MPRRGTCFIVATTTEHSMINGFVHWFEPQPDSLPPSRPRPINGHFRCQGDKILRPQGAPAPVYWVRIHCAIRLVSVFAETAPKINKLQFSAFLTRLPVGGPGFFSPAKDPTKNKKLQIAVRGS